MVTQPTLDRYMETEPGSPEARALLRRVLWEDGNDSLICPTVIDNLQSDLRPEDAKGQLSGAEIHRLRQKGITFPRMSKHFRLEQHYLRKTYSTWRRANGMTARIKDEN